MSLPHGAPDIRNRMTPVATMGKAANQATHEGSFEDMQQFQDMKRLIVIVGTPTGTPDSFSIVLTVRENVTDDSSGDTQMTDIYANDGVGADSLTVTAPGVYVLDIQNTKRYVALSAAVTLVNGSTPLVPIAACFIGERVSF